MIVKELERAGIPAVQICNMTPVAKAMGAIRVYKSNGILYPLGNPELTYEKEQEDRYTVLYNAMQLLVK